MNDMTHPNSAARISDDIGDVLSAIRRLIAEDETMGDDVGQDEPQKIAVGGEILARRYGGNAALARQMAQASHSGVAAVEGEAGGDMADARVAPGEFLEFVGETAMHPFEAEVLAVQDEKPTDAAIESAPLRLSKADRVVPAADETEQATPPRRRSRWARIGIPAYRRQASQPVEAHSAAINEECFAIAEMQPVAEEPAVAVEAVMPAKEAVAEMTADMRPAEDEPPVLAPVEAEAAGAASASTAVLAENAKAEADVPDALRHLIRDMIQEELHGELGQRFSRNLRAVIRREVLAAIDNQM